MDSTVTEIAENIFRISTFASDFGIQFNQILLRGDEPFLMHTGFRKSFDTTRAAVAKVIDPARLRWIGYSHFEADECGALNEWLQIAPDAQALTSVVGAVVNLGDFAVRPARPLKDEEVLQLGQQRLRFLSTPHLPHGWDAGLFFEERSATLFCSDLFFQPGDPPALLDDILTPARDAIRAGKNGPLANDIPYTPYTDANLRRLAALKPRTLATMHGASFGGDGEGALLALAGIIHEFYGV